ncbi:MAG: hypothetical protein ABI663_18015 [Chryseolinea sp.]
MNNALIEDWNIGTKIIFRFLFIYFILYMFPFGLETFPVDMLWTPLIEWTGKYILNLNESITVLPNGSGDTTWNYVQVLVIALLSAIGMMIWSILDWRRQNYSKLFYWLTVIVRYYLALVLIGYGFAKVFKTQFPFPFLERLTQPYGNSSPMGLLWTFMGFSTAYNFFTGFCEALGGFLLFFRRTKMLGAFITIGVMSNIVILNFTYDVPVKLLSIHLLFLTLFLLAPDARRLLNFLILNKPTEPEAREPIFKKRKWNITLSIVKAVVIVLVLGYQFLNAQYIRKQWGDAVPKPFLYGIYNVDLHVVNRDTIPPLRNSTRCLNKIIVSQAGYASLEYMDNAKIHYMFSADTVKHTMEFLYTDSSKVYEFNYVNEGDLYKLKGKAYGDSVFVTMRKNDFLLLNRGFHWINESPYNR